MKVKVKKSFISGFHSGEPGDEIDVSDRLAAKLIKIDVVKLTGEADPKEPTGEADPKEPAGEADPKEPAGEAHSASESPVKVKNGEPPAPKKKTAKTGKSAAKSGK